MARLNPHARPQSRSTNEASLKNNVSSNSIPSSKLEVRPAIASFNGLPDELILSIFEFLLPRKNAKITVRLRRVAALKSLCLTSRRCRRIAQSLLFCTLHNVTGRHLRKVIRVITKHPHLANCVEEVVFVDEAQLEESHTDLEPLANEDWLSDNLNINRIITQIAAPKSSLLLPSLNNSSYIAGELVFLLLQLPNLRRLRLNPTDGPFYQDSNFTNLFYWILEDPGCNFHVTHFSRLREMVVCVPEGQLQQMLTAVLHFPALQSITFDGLTECFAFDSICNNHKCTAKSLTIKGSFIGRDVYKDLLGAFDGLEEFRYTYSTKPLSEPGDGDGIGQLIDLWDLAFPQLHSALLAHKSTLKVLKVGLHTTCYDHLWLWQAGIQPLGSLSEFESLHTLELPHAAFGITHSRVVSLTNFLPTSIQHVVVNADEPLEAPEFPAVFDLFHNMAPVCQSHFSHLQSVSFHDSYSNDDQEHNELVPLFEDAGVLIRTSDREPESTEPSEADSLEGFFSCDCHSNFVDAYRGYLLKLQRMSVVTRRMYHCLLHGPLTRHGFLLLEIEARLEICRKESCEALAELRESLYALKQTHHALGGSFYLLSWTDPRHLHVQRIPEDTIASIFPPNLPFDTLRVYKEIANGAQSYDGLHVLDLAARLRINEDGVRTAAAELLQHSLIETTWNASTFRTPRMPQLSGDDKKVDSLPENISHEARCVYRCFLDYANEQEDQEEINNEDDEDDEDDEVGDEVDDEGVQLHIHYLTTRLEIGTDMALRAVGELMELGLIHDTNYDENIYVLPR